MPQGDEVLKRFVIELSINAKNINKQLSAVTGNMQKTSRTMRTFTNNFSKAAAQLRSALSIGAITAFGAKINSIFTNTGNMFADFNAATGLSIEKSAQFAGAVETLGGTTQGALGSLQNLAQGLEQAKYGLGGLVTATRKYGIHLIDQNGQLNTTWQLLQNLAFQFQTLNPNQQMDLASMVGLDAPTVRLLQKGSLGLRELMKEQERIGTIKAEDTKVTLTYRAQLAKLTQTFRMLAIMLGRALLPPLIKIIDGFKSLIEYLRGHQAFVIAFLAAFAAALLPISAQALSIIAPFLLIGAAIVAAALVAEDVYGYFMGWDSVTGDLVKKWPLLGKYLNYLRTVSKAIWNYLKNFTLEGFIKDIRNLPFLLARALRGLWDKVKEAMFGEEADDKGIGDVLLKGLFEVTKLSVRMNKALGNWIAEIAKDIGGKVGGFILEGLYNVGDQIVDFFDNIFTKINNIFKYTPLGMAIGALSTLLGGDKEEESTPPPLGQLGRGLMSNYLPLLSGASAMSHAPTLGGGSVINNASRSQDIRVNSPIKVSTTGGDPNLIAKELSKRQHEVYNGIADALFGIGSVY